MRNNLLSGTIYRHSKTRTASTCLPQSKYYLLAVLHLPNGKMYKIIFPATPIINRGFGGSSLPDLIRYKNDVIFQYKPKQIVIYCGENDLAGSDTVTVTDSCKQVHKIIRTVSGRRYKDIPIAYISMKPSPSRQHLMPKFEKANMADPTVS